MKINKMVVILLFYSTSCLFSQKLDSEKIKQVYWQNKTDNSIIWNLSNETKLPHEDNIEFNGQNVAAIISYKIDKNKNLKINREIFFPQLRVFIKSTDTKWGHYRAYLKDIYEDDILPKLIVEQKNYEPGILDSIKINGDLQIYHKERQGLKIKRIFVPSMTKRLFVEKWEIENISDSIKNIKTGMTEISQEQPGVLGNYKRIIWSDAPKNISIKPGNKFEFGVYIAAYLNDEVKIKDNFTDVIEERNRFLSSIQNNAVLETPDNEINKMFYFSKIRALESIYQTDMGLMHSPGGGRYYTGVWANDQCEYSSPFFPYVGYEVGNQAALNSYKMFLKNIPEANGKFSSSYEMSGTLTCCGMDRGDAAMIAYGASHYALVTGKNEVATELWKLIEWSLDYCDRQKNEAGVINSESDEMEGRITTGGANLATSSLYYGALKQSIKLAEALNLGKEKIKKYEKQAIELRNAIEKYFGAEIEGLNTYRYYQGHNFLRHWICLPLVMGIEDRKEGTLDALFNKLWNENGVRVEYNPNLAEPDLFWDRGTLYAFRGAFKSGAADRALERLKSFTKTRLLGFHVPYVVEAWPEGNMAHLSAESALYCRIFTEGVLGLEATGFNSFTIRPELPKEWSYFNLRNIKAFDSAFDVLVNRIGEKINIKVINNGKEIYNKKIAIGKTVEIKLK